MIPTDHAIDVMSELQKNFDAGYPEPSSTFTWWLGDVYSSNFGPKRSPRLNRRRRFSTILSFRRVANTHARARAFYTSLGR